MALECAMLVVTGVDRTTRPAKSSRKIRPENLVAENHSTNLEAKMEQYYPTKDSGGWWETNRMFDEAIAAQGTIEKSKKMVDAAVCAVEWGFDVKEIAKLAGSIPEDYALTLLLLAKQILRDRRAAEKIKEAN